MLKKLIIPLFLVSTHSYAATVIPFQFQCRRIFQNYMNRFPGNELRWESQDMINSDGYSRLRQYDDVYYGKGDRKVFIQEVLPPVVKATLGKKMDFNCFSAVMNFYFPGFGLGTLHTPLAGFFHTLVGTTFRSLDFQKGEALAPGDMIIIKIGQRFEHAMVNLGNNIVWQKPNSELPAGFYNWSDVVFSLTEGIPSNQIQIQYYRFDRGSQHDYYSRKIEDSIRNQSTSRFYDPDFSW